jgi:hypothetical protein
VNVQRAIGTNYLIEAAYAGSRGRHMVTKIDINQAPPVMGLGDANVNRPFIVLAKDMRSMSQSQAIGVIDHNALLLKFQRRFANNFSFMNSYTLGKTMDYASDNEAGITNNLDLGYNWGPADYDVRHTLSSNWIYEIPWAREKLYGGWQANGIVYWRTGLPFTVTQAQGVRSTGTGNRPNQVCGGELSSPTVEKWFDTTCSCRLQIRRPRTVTQHETRCADRASSTSTLRSSRTPASADSTPNSASRHSTC